MTEAGVNPAFVIEGSLCALLRSILREKPRGAGLFRCGGSANITAMATLAPTMTADEALDRLRQGNERFLAGRARFPTVQKDVLAELARGQQP